MAMCGSRWLQTFVFAGVGFAGAVLVPDVALAAAWYNCTPVALFEHDGQLQVECSNDWAQVAGVNWIAINLADYTTEEEQRFWSAASSALLSGRKFRVYMTDTDCGFADCRLATSWSLYTF